DSALITFTTGSTGTPKAANRTHGFLKEQFDALIDEIEPSSTDIDMPVLPIVLFVNLGIGCTSVIAKVKMKKLHKLKTERLINQIKANNVSRITASPSLINKLSEFVLEKKTPLSSIQKVFTGGGPVFPDEAGLYLKAFPNAKTKIVYGSTEAEPISSINAEELVSTLIDKGLAVGNLYHKTHLKIIPFEDNIISVKSDHELEKRELESGKKGEIIVAGDHVLKSYFNNQKAFERNKIVTNETTWHRTGDSGFIQNGKLYLIGRCEQIIEQYGKTYSPFVIEHQLKQIEGIEIGTLLLINDQLTLIVESSSSITTLTEKLASLEYDQLKVLKKIPRDTRHNTKIDYGKLKEIT
ncbi:MAG: AMP-binding protein, partial [Flavobacteriales bacterium]